MATSPRIRAKSSPRISAAPAITPTLENPLAEPARPAAPAAATVAGPYDQTLVQADELQRRPYTAAGTLQTLRQHAKGRMTVWERIDVLQDKNSYPTVLYQNWGPNLDGASIVTAVIKIR